VQRGIAVPETIRLKDPDSDDAHRVTERARGLLELGRREA
jgi:hypothetical protein